MRSMQRGREAVLTVRGEAKVNLLLRELHDKKRWLDTMIDALEAAVVSPHHQLIETTGRLFQEGNKERPKVDLGPEQQKELVDLAIQVAKTRARKARIAEAG